MSKAVFLRRDYRVLVSALLLLHLQLQTYLDDVYRVLLETFFGRARLAVGEVDAGRLRCAGFIEHRGFSMEFILSRFEVVCGKTGRIGELTET
jgi:hypothetical protein